MNLRLQLEGYDWCGSVVECQPTHQMVGQRHVPGLQVHSPAWICIHVGSNQLMYVSHITLMFPSLPFTL